MLLPAGVSAAEEFLVARFRLYQWGVYHHKAQQLATSLREALLALLNHDHPAAVQFLDDHDRLVDSATTVGKAVIESIIKYDDNWWISLFKQYIHPVMPTQPTLPVAAALDMRAFVYRTPARPSLWKRPTDLTQQQLVALNEALPDSPPLSDWNEAKR